MPRKKPAHAPASECLIPPRPKPEALRATLVKSSPREEADVARYVEFELSRGAKAPVEVEHLEPILSERVLGRDYKVWDVHTTDGRWWVVTTPMNLYSQELFPSLDYVLSFHIGLMARVESRDSRRAGDKNMERFAAAWRRWEQAAAAVDAAAEAEDFQAVGMKCRECLLAFVRSAQADVSLPAEVDRPKVGDFVQWSRVLAEHAAAGGHGEALRAYLKQLAASTWSIVNWLTHTSSAVRHDAEFVVVATSHVLGVFASSLIRRESKTPDRCPKCSSYQVETFFVADSESEPPYVFVCRACGWEAESSSAESNVS